MPGTNLVSYQERFAKDAAETAAAFAREGRMLSTRGGTFSLAGETLGPKVAVVVIDSWYANEYHPGAFDPDNMTAPTCYAFDREKHKLSPHPSMQAAPDYFKPEHFPCAGCKKNEWGSATTGKGKTCKNRAKLAVLPAGYYTPPKGRTPGELHLFEEAAHFAAADVVMLGVPVTSVENWAKYVSQLAAAHQRPPYAVYTEVAIVPDPKSQYKLQFEMLDLLPDTLFEPVVTRVDAQVEMPFQGYTAPEEKPAPAGPPQARQGMRRF